MQPETSLFLKSLWNLAVVIRCLGLLPPLPSHTASALHSDATVFESHYLRVRRTQPESMINPVFSLKKKSCQVSFIFIDLTHLILLKIRLILEHLCLDSCVPAGFFVLGWGVGLSGFWPLGYNMN